MIDTGSVSGSIDLVDWAGHDAGGPSPQEGAVELARRSSRGDLAPDPHLPDDTKLWAILQSASGGTWRGCIYDTERIAARLAGR